MDELGLSNVYDALKVVSPSRSLDCNGSPSDDLHGDEVYDCHPSKILIQTDDHPCELEVRCIMAYYKNIKQ